MAGEALEIDGEEVTPAVEEAGVPKDAMSLLEDSSEKLRAAQVVEGDVERVERTVEYLLDQTS
ncbi:hypothetical protein ACFL3C_05150 [Patescibacteria group bacterium]